MQAVNEVDGYFKYDQAEQQAVQQQKPWARDPHFFKQCAALRSASCCGVVSALSVSGTWARNERAVRSAWTSS